MFATKDRAGGQIAIRHQDFRRWRSGFVLFGILVTAVNKGFNQIRRQPRDGDGGNDKYGPCEIQDYALIMVRKRILNETM